MVTVSGEIDMETASQFRDAALGALAHGPGTVELDLSGVTFMDSAGLHVLLATRRRAALVGAQLVVSDRSRVVGRLLDIAGVSGLIPRAAARGSLTYQPQG
jgi:anti-anti-sigma factor